MADINKIQQTEDLVDKKKADAEQVYNQANDVSGDSWADELMSDDVRKQPKAPKKVQSAPKGTGDTWADAMMSDDVRNVKQPVNVEQPVEQNTQPAPVQQVENVDNNLYKGEDLGQITVTYDKSTNKQDTWKYTRTIKTYNESHPLAQAARHAKQYGDLLSAGELSAVYANKDWDDLNRQSQELMRNNPSKQNTPQFEHDAQLLSAIHNQMVALEYNFADRNDMYRNIGQKNYRMFLEPMRKGNKYTEFYENLYNSGANLRNSNPLLQYLPDKVEAQKAADEKAGKKKPDNYYFNMALKDKDFKERYHAWSFFGSIQDNMGWNEYKNLGAKASDLREERYKEESAKRFAESSLYAPVSALLDNSVAQAVMAVGNAYDVIKGQPLRSESVNDLLQRSMKYAGEGKNVIRGVLSFIPEAVSIMPVTGVAATKTVGALSKVFTFTPRAMKITTGGLSFMGFEMAKSALGSWSQGREIDWAEMAGNSAKGFLLGAGGSLISEGVAGIKPNINSTVANYAIQGAGKVAETGLFASTEMAMAYLGNDKEATWTSSLLNNGALIISMAIGHGIGNGFGFKSRIGNATIEKVRKAGYNTLANEMAKHTQAVERGAMPKGYSQAAIEEMQSMQQSMGSNGLSWSDYAEVLKPTNSKMTKPGTNSIEKVEDGKGYRIVSYDVNGVEIERSKVYDEVAVDKEFAKRQRAVEKKQEEANVKSFDLMRDSTIKAKAARSVADRINFDDGKSVYNGDGTVNEAFDGITADDVLYAYEVLSEKPAEQRSSDEARVVALFDEAVRDYGAEMPDSNAVKKTLCERYGIEESAFDAAWKADAKDRKGREAEICATYNSIMSRPYEVALNGGEAGTVDGRQVVIKSTVKTDAEGMPLDPNQRVYYDDGTGVKVTTAEHVLMEPTVEDPGELGDRIANENLRKALEAKKEALKSMFAEIPTDVLESNLDIARTAIENGEDTDGSMRLSYIALEEEIQRRRDSGAEETIAPATEESAPIEIDADGSVIEGEESAPIEINERGEVIEPEQSIEVPKADNEIKPVAVPEAESNASNPKDKIDELLDAMGFEKKEERDEQRAFYSNKDNAEQFEKDYKDFVGEKEPQPQVPQPKEEVKTEEKKEETVDDSQQETKVVNNVDSPMPMKKTKKGRDVPDFDNATVEQTYNYLYGEGSDRNRSDSLVGNTIKNREERVEEAQKALDKAKAKEQKLRETATVDDMEALDDAEAATKKADDALKAAQADLEKWEDVQRRASVGKEERVENEEDAEPETPAVEGNGELKDREEALPDAEQQQNEKTAAELEKEFNDSTDEMSRVEQEWDDKIKDYVAEKYPTQATVTAETNAPIGKAERAAMNADPEYKRLLEEQKRALDEAKKKNDEAYNAWQEALKKENKAGETPVAEEKALQEEYKSRLKEVKDSIDEDGTAWLTDYDNETSDLKEPELAASEGLKEEYGEEITEKPYYNDLLREATEALRRKKEIMEKSYGAEDKLRDVLSQHFKGVDVPENALDMPHEEAAKLYDYLDDYIGNREKIDALLEENGISINDFLTLGEKPKGRSLGNGGASYDGSLTNAVYDLGNELKKMGNVYSGKNGERRKEIVKEVNDIVGKMSDEELDEMISDISFSKLPDDVSSAAVAHSAYRKSIASQTETGVKPGKAKKFTAKEVASKDVLRPPMMGVFHDPQGFGVVTDAHVLVADKKLYDKGNKGKIIAEHPIKEAKEEKRRDGTVKPGTKGVPIGGELPGKFPDWRKVVPKKEDTIGVAVDFGSLANDLSGLQKHLKEEWEQQRAANPNMKESFAKWSENATVLIKFPDGTIHAFNMSTLDKFVRASAGVGAKELRYYEGEDGRAISAEGKDGVALCMPVMLNRYALDGVPMRAIDLVKGPTDAAMISSGKGASFQKGDVAKPAKAETKQARNFTARTIKKLRKAGVKVKVATQAEAQRVRELAEKVGAQLQAVFHGSANDFDAFDHSHMGEGEGAQAYGWGTYVTQVEGIGRTYAKASAAKSAGIRFRGADDVAAVEKMFPEQNPDSKPISRAIINIINDLRQGFSFDNAKSYAVQSRKDWLGRHQHALDEYRKGLDAKEKIIERIENMSDEEYANTNFWDEANIAAYDNNNKENAAFFAWKRAAAIRAGNHRGRELTKEELLTELRKNLRDEKIYTLKDYEAAVKDAKDAYDFVNGLDESDFEAPNGGRFLYEVEIPDNDGTNYIPYKERLSEEQFRKVVDGLLARGYEQVESENGLPRFRKKGEENPYFDIVVNPKATGADIYAELESRRGLGSSKDASEFLHECGFAGIEYPAQYRSGGRSDNAKNYVIFNEGDAKITNKTEFLMTKDGTVYGWHDSEGIHLTEEGFNPDTPLHEYTHGFMEMIRRTNPEKYERIVSGLRESEVWEEVLNDPEYQDIKGDEIKVASEVASRVTGRENSSRVNSEFDFSEGIFTKANAIAAKEKVKNALKDLWDTVAEWFGAKLDKAMPYDRFARMTIKELNKGVNPDAVAEGADVELMGSRVDKRMTEIGEKLNDVNMSPKQRAVADVYSGKADNIPIKVTREDGERTITMIQGSERAGTKHSIYRHYGTTVGVITHEDILRVPEVAEKGVITEKKRGNVRLNEYKYTDENGTRYTLVTELKGDGEVFNDFYTNKKAPKQTPKIPEGDTPEGARSNVSDAQSSRKDTPEFSVVQGNGENSSQNIRDYAAEMRELMRRRLRGEDVAAELEQLRADRRAAEAARSAESAPATSTGGAGNGEPPIEPPTPPAPPTPEPAPELPPTGYDRPMSPIEIAQEAAIKAVADTKASLEQRNAARRELDASLRNLHKAMRLQKEYDRATVENVVSLCKMMVQSGLIDRRYISNLTPLFTKLKDSTGKEDLTSTVNGIMDVMLKSQERSIRNELNTLLNTKAQRINQSGVVTQGGVDLRGQRTLQSLNENFGKSVEDIDRRITQLEDLRGRIPENSEERLNEVDDKIQGALLAKAYMETAKNHEDNITAAEEELAEIKAQYKDGELGLKEYTEQKHALEAQIRSYRMSHADAMWDYVKTMRGIVAEGRSRAKDFIEAQKAHKNEIRHNAYSDMAGTPQYTQSRPGGLAKAVNSSVSQFVSSSLYTLDTMLRQLGHKHAKGEGYLYERFGRGWLDARDNEIRDYWADREELDKKTQELFGVKHFANLIDAIRKMPKMDVPYKDGGDIKNHTLDQAQLMYIYMVNKMEDGIVKLRRMGISEEDVETIKNFMNPKLVELADWLQDDFLPSRREGYNEVHRRMFGADMDMVENYVPLRIDKGNLTETVDINNGQNEPSLASTVTGGIIKRTHNTTPIDIMGTNAIDMILEHLDEMNHWKNFAEWNRDVNTLLSDKTFRNKVKNTTTIYGSGDKLWKHLKDVFFIAGGTYKPKGEGIDKAMVNIAKGVSAAKVSFRMFTATKQLLSLPVFAANCNVGYMVKNMAKPAGSWNWCMENLPSFKQRWKSRIAGDTRLEDTDIDWQYTHKKWVEKASKWGLSPNAFVDAMTVAVGARSVYEQRYKRYRKDGYDDVAADRRARQDATAAFNQTQQSSEKMFVAPMQVDRTVLAVGASLFRNASMGYERQFVEGLRNLKHLFGKERVVDEDGNVSTVSYKTASIEFMKKQMERNGLTETQAESAAKRIYNRSIWRNALKIAMFGFGAQMAWNLGGKLPYLAAQGYNAIFGDDDERKQAGANTWDTTKEALWHAAAGGWLEGLPFGNVVSDGINNEINGENFFKFSPDLLPFFGDTEDVANHFDGKNKLRGVTDLVNLGAQIFIGVNPQTFLDVMTGIVDITAGKKQSQADFGTAKEALLLTMRIMQCPQSQLDRLYIDELGMNARQAQSLTPEQVARRYAFYKAHHDVPYLWHLYNQEKQDELIKDYEKNFSKKLNDDVKEDGGTPEDYHDLMDSSTTNKEHDKYRNKEIDALSAQGPEALMKAWEKERDKGAAADYKYIKSLMTRYQKDVYGKGKTPDDADEAYEALHGEDIKEQALKIGRDLGFGAQDSYFQMSQYKAQHTSAKDPVMKEFSENGGGFKYSKKGKFFKMEDYTYKVPVEDVAKRAKALKVIEEHPEELRRNYRNGMRMAKIKALYKDIEAESLKKERDSEAMQKDFEEILQLLEDERKDAAQWEKDHPTVKFTKRKETY